jgi:hypothetical protein
MSTSFSKEDVLLIWAFSEAFSIRWGEKFKSDFNLSDYYTITQSKDPFSLNDGLKQKLLDWIKLRRKKLLDKYIEPSKSFKLTNIQGEDIEKIITMPEMAWKDRNIALLEFMNMRYDKEILTDTRVSAQTLLDDNADISNSVGYPIIAYDEKLKTNVLIEGYTRCIFSVLKQNKTKIYQPIQVIICER